jgi:hypothetical protein
MTRVGIAGEFKNDIDAISHLIHQKYQDSLIFKNISPNLRGDDIVSPKGRRVIINNFKLHNCKFAICIRDLDGFITETDKIKNRLDWHSEIETEIKESVLLLNIWELESLIFADIEVFNDLYKTKLNFKGDPEFVKEPKEELKRKTRNNKKEFHENDCPAIFKKLRFEVVFKNSKTFKKFIQELDKKLVA